LKAEKAHDPRAGAEYANPFGIEARRAIISFNLKTIFHSTENSLAIRPSAAALFIESA